MSLYNSLDHHIWTDQRVSLARRILWASFLHALITLVTTDNFYRKTDMIIYIQEGKLMSESEFDELEQVV